MSYRIFAGLLLLMSILALAGCAGGKPMTLENYYRALDNTDPKKAALLESRSAAEMKAIEKFYAFYEIFSEDRIRRGVRDLYAADAYFRDGYKEVEGIDNIEAYFIATTKAIHECTFDIQDWSSHEGNYYFRWIMRLRLKRDKDDLIEQVGMSHVRFNPEGKIVFHQDYWDTSVVFERVPVMGSVIRWVKERF
jgi:limonene-1,2-epoxide hydrolase